MQLRETWEIYISVRAHHGYVLKKRSPLAIGSKGVISNWCRIYNMNWEIAFRRWSSQEIRKIQRKEQAKE